MFEAIHGSAPRRAGQNLANPSGLLFGAIMMLVHIGQPEVAERIHNAWLRTIEEGIHTYDIYREGISKKTVGTKEFAQAVVSNLGKLPEKLPVKRYGKPRPLDKTKFQYQPKEHHFELVGVDIFIKDGSLSAQSIAERIMQLGFEDLKLVSIANRGMQLWPSTGAEHTATTDSWRCRFKTTQNYTTQMQILELQKQLVSAGFDIVGTANLYNVDGKRGYTLAQGE